MNLGHTVLGTSSRTAFTPQYDTPQVLDGKYDSRDGLFEALKKFYFGRGYALSLRGSRKDKYVIIGCDRRGKYCDRKNVPTENRKMKNTKSRLTDCPFRIYGKREEDGFWVAKMKNEAHNHEPSVDMSGHPSIRVLSKEDMSVVDHMSRSGIPPRNILSSLRLKNPEILAVSRTIYNAKVKIQRETLGGGSSVQVLCE